MKKIIKVSSIICLIIFIVLLYVSIKQNNGDNFNKIYNENYLYDLNNSWDIEYTNSKETRNLPINIKKNDSDYVYLYNKIDDNSSYDELILYTSLGSFDVFIDNEEVYSFHDEDFLKYKNKMTTLLHRIKINDKEKNNEIKIRAYLGDKDNISFIVEKSYLSINGESQNLIISDEIFKIITVSIILILGVSFTIIGVVAKRKKINELADLIDVGKFSVIIAVYSFLHSLTSYSLIKNLQVINTIYYTGLIFMPLPILNIVGSNKKIKNKFPVLVMKYVVYINYIIQTILTLFEIFDYKKMILFTHINLFMSILIAIYVLIRNIKKELYILLCTFPMMILGLVKLLNIYINTKIDFKIDNDLLLQISFIYFVVVYIIYIVSKYFKYYFLSIKSMTYKRLAYTDFLTNIGNRSAFERRIKQLDDIGKDISILWFISIDINNFKMINDTKGHAEGDRILRSLALLLNKAFSKITKDLFRIGGDEFFIIISNYDEDTINEVLKDLYTNIEEFNAENENKISIALGYDNIKTIEYTSIKSAISKVDKKMYDNKRKIKNGYKQ